MVLPTAPLPTKCYGKCIDDVITVLPATSRDSSVNFSVQYRKSLSILNMEAAPVDPLRKKSFETSTSGECLGSWFNTEDMTWCWSDSKISRLLQRLQRLGSDATKSTLHEIQACLGYKFVPRVC